MSTTDDNQTGPTWDQFRLQHNWGIQGNEHRLESDKAKKKRIAGSQQNATKKKKQQQLPNLQQLSLDGDNITTNDAEAFADVMKRKPHHTVRIALQNIQLLPANSRHYKSRQLVNHIAQAELDALLINEVGLNWHAVAADNQWIERVTGKLNGSKAVFAHNTTELKTTDTIQYGGVGIIATQELAHRITTTGVDPRNLGRWTWIRIQGKEGHTMRIITAYRPWESPGASTVFHQQSRGLSQHADHRNPITALMKDLAQAITEWKITGDHIIIRPR